MIINKKLKWIGPTIVRTSPVECVDYKNCKGYKFCPGKIMKRNNRATSRVCIFKPSFLPTDPIELTFYGEKLVRNKLLIEESDPAKIGVRVIRVKQR